jgi:hypothetical protein
LKESQIGSSVVARQHAFASLHIMNKWSLSSKNFPKTGRLGDLHSYASGGYCDRNAIRSGGPWLGNLVLKYHSALFPVMRAPLIHPSLRALAGLSIADARVMLIKL